MSKKLLFFGAFPPPYGGIASHLYSLLPELENKGYNVVSVTLSQKERVLQNNGIKNIFLSQTKYFKNNIAHVVYNYWQCRKYQRNLKFREFIRIVNISCMVNKIAREEQVDAMFIYENHNGMIIPVLRKHFKASYPLAFMIFGDFYLRPAYYLDRSEYFKDIFLETETILASSKYCADAIQKVFGFTFPVKVIYVGVDHLAFASLDNGVDFKSKLNIPSSSTIILFMGRMNKEMGLDFVIDNSLEILGLGNNVFIIIAGAEGDLSMDAKALADNNDRVKCFIDISFDEKVNFFNISDIIIAPTMERRACMGISIKEAMASSKPVIASESGGIKEAIVHGGNGYLIPIQNGKLDKEKFFNHTSYLVDNPSAREKMGNEGLKKILASFTNEQSANKYLNLLNTWFNKN